MVNDRPSTAQFREKLPWFLEALPSADCAKGGHGAYTNSVDLNGSKDTHSLYLNAQNLYFAPSAFAVTFLNLKILYLDLSYNWFSGYEGGVIQASEFRTYHTPLNRQVCSVISNDPIFLASA